MHEYWVSTPRWTCLIRVNNDVIVYCAPLLWNRCVRKSWPSLQAKWRQVWGASLHIAELPAS